MDHRAFHPGLVLAFLDDLAARFGPCRLPSIGPAWDATWLVCVASDPRHETTARSALASVIIELDGLGGATAPGHRGAPAKPGRP
jgi:hypothetical protein